MTRQRSLRPLRFHEALSDALQTLEPGLWRWFSSDSYGKKYADTVKLELLRSTYRLPKESNEKLYVIGEEVAEAFQLDAPVTLYQAQEDGALNAGLVFVPGEIHVVLRGPVMQTLSDGEVRALFGHELAHHKLWTEASGKFRIAEALIEHVASHQGGAPSHVQSALRHRRWTEIYADRGSLVACDDLTVAVGCLVKMTTGLREVDPQAYLGQADEAIRAAAKPSEGTTHPDAFIRAFALKAWDGGEEDDVVRRLVEGVPEIDTLDLVQQRALTRATQDLLELVLAPSWMRTEATLAHARRFFPDVTFAGSQPSFTLPEGGESVAEYLAYLLLDFGMADPEIEEESLAHAAHLAEAIGVPSALAKIAKKELRMSASSYAELGKRGRELARQHRESSPSLASEAP
jgi:hypothetical protein